MFRLDNLIISGLEVYSVPQPPPASRDVPADAERPPAEHGAGLLRALLVHTFAVGGLSLPWTGRGR
jgi:hypothetical protein